MDNRYSLSGQGITGNYRELQGITGNYRELQGITGPALTWCVLLISTASSHTCRTLCFVISANLSDIFLIKQMTVRNVSVSTETNQTLPSIVVALLSSCY